MLLRCNACGEEKDSSEFYARKSTPRGFRYECKICENHRRNVNRYGITKEDFKKLYEQQEGACAVCGKFLEYNGLDTHIDHDHDTGKVRGILCSNCNTALGLLKENVEIILALAMYKLASE